MERVSTRVSSKTPGRLDNSETYRELTISQAAEIELLKKEIRIMEEQKYKAYIRIKELTSELAELK